MIRKLLGKQHIKSGSLRGLGSLDYKFFMLLGIVLLFVAAPVQGLTIDKVYTIPENLSSGHPYLFVVETSALLDDSSRVSWSLTTPQKKAAGNFNKISPEKWVCFFADDDTNTCGPIVFDNVATGVIIDIYAETPDESKSKQFTFNSGDLKFLEKECCVKGENNIFIGFNVDGNVQGDVRYTIYDNKLNVVKSDKVAEFPQTSIVYKLDINLSSGEYYIVFEANTSDKGPGGYVKHITLGGKKVISKINVGDIIGTEDKKLGETYQKTIKLENPSNEDFFNLSVESPNIPNLKVNLDKTELKAGEYANLEFKIENIRTSLFIDNSLKIYSGINKTLIGEVPINLTINLLAQASGNFPIASVSPAAWVPDNQPLASDILSKTFDVNNVGNADLTLNNYTVEGLPKDKVTVKLHPNPIAPGSKGQVFVKFTPPSEGLFTGKIILHSNAAADEAIEVNIRVYKNLINDISSLKADIKNKKSDLIKKGYSEDQINKTFSFIKRKINQAENDYNRNDHDSARINYAIANDQFRAIDNLLAVPSGGNPLGIIQIIIVVIIIALVGFVVYKKKFSKLKEEDEYYDEEYDDEEYS